MHAGGVNRQAGGHELDGRACDEYPATMMAG
jgi:hypothetical protein